MEKEIMEVKSALESMPGRIERLIYRNGDDVAVSISRSFERLEERLDAAEARIYSRLADIGDEIKDELTALGQK